MIPGLGVVLDAVEGRRVSNTIGKVFFKDLRGQRFNQVGNAGAVIGGQFRENDDRDSIGAWENLQSAMAGAAPKAAVSKCYRRVPNGFTSGCCTRQRQP